MTYIHNKEFIIEAIVEIGIHCFLLAAQEKRAADEMLQHIKQDIIIT
jgi:signal transduction histidine kinase